MTVKRAHEVVAGDWINVQGTARRVDAAWATGLDDVFLQLGGTPGQGSGHQVAHLRTTELVEVMDK